MPEDPGTNTVLTKVIAGLMAMSHETTLEVGACTLKTKNSEDDTVPSSLVP